MKKKIIVSILIMILLLTLACEPLDKLIHDPNPTLQYEERVKALLTLEAEESGSGPADGQQKPEDTPQPAATIQPTATQEYIPHTYSVETTNVGTCICPVRAGEVEVTLVFKGDNLEMPNFMGGPLIFKKVGEDRYEHRYMTEKSTGPVEVMNVITFFDWGYKEEFYTDNSSKLCCVYDYLRLD